MCPVLHTFRLKFRLKSVRLSICLTPESLAAYILPLCNAFRRAMRRCRPQLSVRFLGVRESVDIRTLPRPHDALISLPSRARRALLIRSQHLSALPSLLTLPLHFCSISLCTVSIPERTPVALRFFSRKARFQIAPAGQRVRPARCNGASTLHLPVGSTLLESCGQSDT